MKYTEVMYQKIAQLKKSGASVKDACKEVGVTTHAFYKWNRRNWTPPPTAKTSVARNPRLINLQIPDSKMPFVILMGNPSDVSQALDRLAQIHGNQS